MSFPQRDRIRIIYHPEYADAYPTASCECPDRITSIMSALGTDFAVVTPDPCTRNDLLRCHSEELIASEQSQGSRYRTACLAAGGAIRAAELALEGFMSFGVIRPPGHHANPDHNWGFCFFNNIAVALRKLISEGRIASAVILDIDLHYGDGTDAIFRGDKAVRVINIQSGDPGDYIRETESALQYTEPADLIGISAGFDQYVMDWGANLSTGDYHRIGRIAGAFARDKARGRIFSILEGGYYLPDLGRNVLALMQGIAEENGSR